jgi:N-acetylglucosamine-6-phosphate deacetylase
MVNKSPAAINFIFMKAFINAKVFTGDALLDNHSVTVDHDIITDLYPSSRLTSAKETIDVKGGYLVPAFADLQIYGGNGLLFGEYPSVASLAATYNYSLHGGASHILPTIATNSYEKIFEAINAVANYWKQQLPGALGLHVEGPYINPVKKGAHVEAFIRKPDLQEVMTLIEKGRGVIKMITLAPEICSREVLQYLLKQDVILSAGHSNATYEEASIAFADGIPAATHLFNAMSPLQHRAPGLVGAVFNASTAKSSVVADGHHVDFAAIRIAKKLMGERLFYITDAVTENEGIYPHKLEGDKYVVADGILSGSALTMLKAVKNGIKHAGIPVEESFRMASLYPWQLFGKESEYGRIARNYKAELLWLDEMFEIRGIYSQSRLTRF